MYHDGGIGVNETRSQPWFIQYIRCTYTSSWLLYYYDTYLVYYYWGWDFNALCIIFRT